MTPIRLNRRRFLGASAAAGLALSQGTPPVAGSESTRPVRLGLIGVGNRGTALLRTALELPGVSVVAVADRDPKHALRAQGIAEKACQRRPEAYEASADLLAREDVDAVLVALPCDLHATAYCDAIAAGKHIYAEKPLAPTLAECDLVITEAEKHPELVFHVGYQRRSNPRFAEAVELVRRGDLGTLLSARGQWVSSNGPVNGHEGWLSRRERSGDWMVEQAVHVWDVLHWIVGEEPVSAYGHGRRDLFATVQPDRDVTDHYSVMLNWPDGLHATFTQSWIDPADDAFTGSTLQVVGTAGGLDLATGVATFRDRTRPRLTLQPGNCPDTRFALAAFLAAVRADGPTSPPLTLTEARAATQTGLLVRRAVDEAMGRAVGRAEV